ncbi:MAG TPA: carboxypeptidase-like regulatory domain-containing protein [Phaeodactylibacter sp.]|nr:carboxypeptidase-like regulatory domain-containing protein [Phaeodactylibacter sp.]
MRIFLFLFVSIFSLHGVFAQAETKDNLVQFTGMVLDGSDEELIPVSYTNIYLKGKGRGTYSDLRGYFTIVVEKGDTVTFSAIGYKEAQFVIPDTLEEDHYSIVQLMTRDTFNLPETVVFPWPSREHFKIEFLAMDVSDILAERAMENLAEEALRRQRADIAVDGNESADFYLRQQAKTNYYIGQTPPMNIFNVVAWKEFFEAWKRGDFKKKKKKK